MCFDEKCIRTYVRTILYHVPQFSQTNRSWTLLTTFFRLFVVIGFFSIFQSDFFSHGFVFGGVVAAVSWTRRTSRPVFVPIARTRRGTVNDFFGKTVEFCHFLPPFCCPSVRGRISFKKVRSDNILITFFVAFWRNIYKIPNNNHGKGRRSYQIQAGTYAAKVRCQWQLDLALPTSG